MLHVPPFSQFFPHCMHSCQWQQCMWYLTFIGPHCISWTTAVFCTIRVPHASHKCRLSLFHNTFIIGPHVAFQDHDHVRCQKSWVNTISCSIRLGKVLLSWCAIVECSLHDLGSVDIAGTVAITRGAKRSRRRNTVHNCTLWIIAKSVPSSAAYNTIRRETILFLPIDTSLFRSCAEIVIDCQSCCILLVQKAQKINYSLFNSGRFLHTANVLWHVPCPSHPTKR